MRGKWNNKWVTSHADNSFRPFLHWKAHWFQRDHHSRVILQKKWRLNVVWNPPRPSVNGAEMCLFFFAEPQPECPEKTNKKTGRRGRGGGRCWTTCQSLTDSWDGGGRGRQFQVTATCQRLQLQSFPSQKTLEMDRGGGVVVMWRRAFLVCHSRAEEKKRKWGRRNCFSLLLSSWLLLLSFPHG